MVNESNERNEKLRTKDFLNKKMALLFSLIGDSNLRLHITKNSERANPNIKSCQVIVCGVKENFLASLQKVRPESNVCIVSSVSSFISDAEGPEFVSQKVEPVLREVRDVLHGVCADHPTRRFMVAPPMYRSSPLWYREGLPEIMSLFSQVLTSGRPENLHLLTSFSTPEFDQTGIHLTPYSGLEYILSLFDGSQELIASLASGLDEVSIKNSESSRVLEDRVVALEQDHRRLNKVGLF